MPNMNQIFTATSYAAWHGLEAPDAPAGDPVGDVYAYVNHGRWVADCPQPGCTGAMMVTEQQPMHCGNRDCGGGPWTVAFPAERQQIEVLLLLRPVDRNRNWRPGESLAALRAENAEHGL